MRTLSLVFLGSLFLGACGGDDGGDTESFKTFEDCFDDHHNEESLPVQDAIVVCCIDHPIGDPNPVANVVCGDTQASCESYVGASLDPADATDTDVTAACADYLTRRD